ncbi:hypothetical protein [Streptomyces sp. NPDC127038]|uniref:hypothetical protein n=1 Tax=Streptomyces sp. NPDC127038 TaxID=3347114 RepID=UPI00365E308F
MGWLDRVLGDDRQRAKTQYQGRESASETAARKRREGHRARVFRDGDQAGQKFRGRRDWT